MSGGLVLFSTKLARKCGNSVDLYRSARVRSFRFTTHHFIIDVKLGVPYIDWPQSAITDRALAIAETIK